MGVATGAMIFDVGGVFVVPHRDPVLTALDDADVDVVNEDVELAHFRGIAVMDSHLGVNQDWRWYLSGYLSSLGVSKAHEPIAREVLAALWRQPSIDLWRHVLQDSVESLRLLAGQGFRLGVVSNSDGTVVEQLATHSICKVGAGSGVEVACILDSATVGVAKPDPAILRLALDELNVDARDAIYVGDSVRYDIACAEAAGVKAIHFDPHGLCVHPTPHPHVRSLRELLTT